MTNIGTARKYTFFRPKQNECVLESYNFHITEFFLILAFNLRQKLNTNWKYTNHFRHDLKIIFLRACRENITH